MFEQMIDEGQDEREADAARRREFNELPAFVRLNRYEIAELGRAALEAHGIEERRAASMAIAYEHDTDACLCNNEPSPCVDCREVFERRRALAALPRPLAERPIGQMTDAERVAYFAGLETPAPVVRDGYTSTLPVVTPAWIAQMVTS